MRAFLISLLVILSTPALASKPVVAWKDLTYAVGTGIPDLQILFGGEDEDISGSIDKEAIRRSFHTNMLGIYRCHSAEYKGKSKTGKMDVNFELDNTSKIKGEHIFPSNIRVKSKDFDTSTFLSCVSSHWQKVKMPIPREGTISSINMPILIQVRAKASLEN